MSSRFPSFASKNKRNPPSDDHVSFSSPSENDTANPQSFRRASHNHSNLPLASSFSSRAPARSFVQNKPSLNHPGLDARHYSSADVREDTASLAHNHLSLRRGSVPTGGDDAITLPTRHDSINSSAATDVILEMPEPSSPGTQESLPRNSSALSDLFKQPSVPIRTQSSAIETLSDHQPTYPPRIDVNDDEDTPTEQTPLFETRTENQKSSHDKVTNYDTVDVERQRARTRKKPNKFQELAGHAARGAAFHTKLFLQPSRWSAKAVWNKAVVQPIYLLPCVFLGLLLNVLDALSYGMILFPLGEPVFANTGPDGISMFYISCIVSQLVYSCGGSIFRGAVGSEMIEVVPFFHKMTYSILARLGNADPKIILATTITSYALSSIITGLVFFLLGVFKLGSLVSFFPRHILIGCIGGVGFFLFVTGIEVSARLDGSIEYNLSTLRALFQQDTVALWIIPLFLSIVLKTVKLKVTSPKLSPYIVPVFFIAVAATFYIVVIAVPSLNLDDIRDAGWIFAKVEAGVPFYHFYSYYDFNAVDWNAVAETIPAMFALTFFGILHVPINVPALAVATKEDDLNLNRELVAHGFSNAISGFVGSIQNYLVYVNSELFMSNGGDNRLAGILLALATTGVLVAGPGMIGYVPVMVVGALIFYLGIDLLDEAVVDTWGKMGRLEYLTVIAIVLIMGIYDFVAGILAGIILACLNFVVQTSRKSAIRATYSGALVESTVRRHPVQRYFLHEVGYQIYVTKLAGYLFFGSIVAVEKNSRALIEEEAFRAQPIRYLIFDFAHVSGVDYSAAEAFVRMQRVIQRRGVRMIMCGVAPDSEAGVGLRNVGLWSDEACDVQFFESLNNALEYCENELLKAFYKEQDLRTAANSPRDGYSSPTSLDVPASKKTLSPKAFAGMSGSFSKYGASPRQHFLAKAASTTLDTQSSLLPEPNWATFEQPLPLLLQTFRDISPKDQDFWFRASPYFHRHVFNFGELVFKRGDAADNTGFIVLESGVLRATYTLPVGTYHESIVAGTCCGELPFFSETMRTATVIAERECVTWVLDGRGWNRMQREWSEGSQELLRCALRLTKERMDAVTGYVVAVAG